MIFYNGTDTPEKYLMCRILLLDDEVDLREEVADSLRQRGHEVVEIGSVRQFYQFFHPERFDILMMDRMLPDGDGLDLVEEVRRNGARCGIVIFTALDSTRDRIQGYENGADHYATKPIRIEELLAVLGSLSWRVAVPRNWRLDVACWRLTAPDGASIELTALEHGFLMSLARHPGEVRSRRQLLDAIGKDLASYDPRNLDALVLRLRKKVASATDLPLPLKTAHGMGYVLTQRMDSADPDGSGIDSVTH